MAQDIAEPDETVGGFADRGQRFLSDYRGLFIRIGSVIVGLILWELYSIPRPDYLFPGLLDIYEELLVHYFENDLIGQLQNSLLSLSVGYVLAGIVGISVGFGLGLSKRMEMMVYPYVGAFYVAPISAIVPAIILLGGSNFGTRVFVIFLFAVFEITINTFEGVKTTPQGYFEVSRSFGASRAYEFRKVVFPYSLPFIFSGLRLGVGRAVIGLVIAEILLDFANLGALIRLSQNRFNVAGVFAIVLILTAIAILLTQLVQMIQKRMLDWEPAVKK